MKEQIQLSKKEIGTDQSQLAFEKSIVTPFDYIETSKLNNKEFLENLIENGTYQDLKVHLIRLNALFRNLPVEEHNIDGENVRVFDSLVPISSEYKEQVVENAFSALKNMAPKDRGILIYNVLGAVHLFSDGNGRSMRVWHHLLSDEKIDSEKIEKLTEHGEYGIAKGRGEMQHYFNNNINYTSGMVNYFAFESILDQLKVDDINICVDGPSTLRPQFNDETINSSSIKDLDRVKNICANDMGAVYCPFNIMTMHMLAKEDSSFNAPPFEISEKNGTKVYEYTDDNIIFSKAEQVKRFIKINNELKLKHFKMLIDIFENPDKHRFENGEEVRGKVFYKK